MIYFTRKFHNFHFRWVLFRRATQLQIIFHADQPSLFQFKQNDFPFSHFIYHHSHQFLLHFFDPCSAALRRTSLHGLLQPGHIEILARIQLQWLQQKLPNLPHLQITASLQHRFFHLRYVGFWPISACRNQLGFGDFNICNKQVGACSNHLFLLRSVLSAKHISYGCSWWCTFSYWQQHISRPLNMSSYHEPEQ